MEFFLESNTSFKDYKANFGRQFVALLLSDKSSKDLRSWCQKNGFDLTKSFSGADIPADDFEFHTTIYYTSNEVYLKSGEFMIQPVLLEPMGFDLFGKAKNIPVLKLNPKAANISDFRSLFTSQGLQDAWPEWKPHVSLSYNYQSSEVPKTLPDFPLYADQVVIKKSS